MFHYVERDGEMIPTDKHGLPLGHSKHEEITEAIRLLTEAKTQAGHDLCGEQRAFILPRLERAWALIVSAHPQCSVRGMKEAKDAWGDSIMTKGDGQ